MYSYTAVALAAATFVTFFQPCPAPPVALAAVSGAVAGTAGTVVGNAEQGGAQKRDAVSDAAVSGIAKCLAAASNTPPQMAPEVQAYNSNPHNGAMAAVHGTTTQINSTAVRLDGIPHEVLGKMSDLIKATPNSQNQRRSLRFEKY
ncbi:hypothetical protein G7Y79_00016g040700 [Physcia stellaris]|nr:hypothetical protein G7Y79_00016g040700 [Physcia stellaris]